MKPSPRGLVIAAPSSGSGKTVTTLGLLALLKERGLRVKSCKAGPDYIDPEFHAAATGAACFNLDPWAMRPATLAALFHHQARDADIVIVEGVMGLFDGVPQIEEGRSGSSADLAKILGLPVILVINAKGQGVTAGAVIEGLVRHDPKLAFAGVIFNNVGSSLHRDLLQGAAAKAGIKVLGYLPKVAALKVPERHLGLVQASEHKGLAAFFATARKSFKGAVDIEALLAAAGPIQPGADDLPPTIPPLGQRIALAQDIAFAFAYPFHLMAWKKAGAEILPFSPLKDEAPARDADAIFLPGGYPELHAGRLAGNANFLGGLRQAAGRGTFVYGECGGYMVLGEGLIDAKGQRHALAGLLPTVTNFQRRKLHLGYRAIRLLADSPLGKKGGLYRGHEFHYAALDREEGDKPLFQAEDARRRDLGSFGRSKGSVMGSFLHLLDRA